jgi:hypothetical protein
MPLAVGAPVAVVAALLALAFLLAWNQWGQVIVKTLDVNLPVVGNVIGGLVADGLEAAYLVTAQWLDAILDPVVNFLIGPIAAVENAVGAIGYTLDQTANAVATIVAVKLPNNFTGAVNAVISEANSISATLSNTIYQNYQDLSSVVSQIGADVQQGLAAADTYTDEAIGRLEPLVSQALADGESITDLAAAAAATAVAGLTSQLQGLIDAGVSTASSYADSLFHTAESDISTGFNDVKGFAEGLLAGAIGITATDITNSLRQGLSGIYTDIESSGADVITVAAGTDIDIIDAIKAIPKAIPTDIAGLATLAGVTTLALTRYLEDCGIPNCQNLSQYGKDLQSLLGLVADANFLSFLVELVEHPGDAATTIDDTFGSAISDTVSGFRELVGVL